MGGGRGRHRVGRGVAPSRSPAPSVRSPRGDARPRRRHLSAHRRPPAPGRLAPSPVGTGSRGGDVGGGARLRPGVVGGALAHRPPSRSAGNTAGGRRRASGGVARARRGDLGRSSTSDRRRRHAQSEAIRGRGRQRPPGIARADPLEPGLDERGDRRRPGAPRHHRLLLRSPVHSRSHGLGPRPREGRPRRALRVLGHRPAVPLPRVRRPGVDGEQADRHPPLRDSSGASGW